jgi:flavin reductase (DIM6/NTAB) family NADH-FMN oxidoreductase RutF
MLERGNPVKQPIATQHIHRLLAPGPVVLVTATLRGQSDVTTAAWVTPLSGDPPLVGVALRERTLIHALIRRSEEFTLNVPPAHLLREVHHCGTVSGADEDKWPATALHATSARQVTAPWIEECLAHLECGLVEVVPVGDHTLFVGQVLAAWAEDWAFTDGWQPDKEEARLLHHLGGPRYGVLTAALDATKPATRNEG